jgi:hypothetical protein
MKNLPDSAVLAAGIAANGSLHCSWPGHLSSGASFIAAEANCSGVPLLRLQ